MLSIAQMPRGCPVATMAINGSMNAGLLAASIIGNFDEKIKSNLEKWKRLQTKSVKKNHNLMTISTLGIIGSGQLGSLLCQAAKKT